MNVKLFFILVLLVFLGGCYQVESSDDFVFQINDCKDSFLNFEEGINKIQWYNNNSVEVKVLKIINCCNKILNGSYRIEDRNIFLNYEMLGESECNCICMQNITYKINDLPDENFEFVLN